MRVAMATNATVTNVPAAAIDITRYSSYNKLVRVTARVIAMASKNPKAKLEEHWQNIHTHGHPKG